MAVGRKRIVEAPNVVPARFGLLSVATVIDDTTAEWRNGVQFQPDACGPAKSYADDCPAVGDRTKAVDEGVRVGGGQPFTVYAGIDCSWVGFGEDRAAFEAEIERRARQALTIGEGRAVEDVFWTGTTDNSVEIRPHLAEDTETTDGRVVHPDAEVLNGGTALPLVRAIGALEDAMADCYGGEPVLHMRRSAALQAVQLGAVERDGARLRTGIGSLVAAGAGYPGTSRTGAAAPAGQQWLFATGSVVARRSDVAQVGDFASTINRVNNGMLRLVERTYAVAWDCCLFTVLADLTA